MRRKMGVGAAGACGEKEEEGDQDGAKGDGDEGAMGRWP